MASRRAGGGTWARETEGRRGRAGGWEAEWKGAEHHANEIGLLSRQDGTVIAASMINGSVPASERIVGQGLVKQGL